MTSEHIGRYEIEQRLGAGSMAVVYKAVDPVIGRTVAIKTIRFDTSLGFEHDELRERFYREAKNAGILTHLNIVTIFDIGAEGDLDYIVMEYVEGESLQQWLAKYPIPPVDQTVAIIVQIASGLDYAAAHGIIHRDIKPANILLTSDMSVKIADFGIAKAVTSKLTQTGAVIGSPSYMSPEQAMGKTLDGRSDIFSLGIIFYEMLTGEKPFGGTNPSTIIYKILHQEPVQPQQLNVTLHPAFNEIVGRMLAKDPEKRYQRCSQLIQDLKNYASITIKEEKPHTPPAPIPVPFAAKAQPKSGGGFRVFLIACLLLAAVAAGGYFYYWKYQKPALQETARIQTTPAIPAPETQIAAQPTTEDKGPAKIPDTSAIPEDAQPPASGKELSAAVLPNSDLPASESTGMQATPPEKETIAADLPAPKKSASKRKSDNKTAAADQPIPEAQKPARSAKKEAPAADEPRAEVRLEFAGASYPVTVFDGAAALKGLSAENLSIQIPAGNHRFRLVSEDGFLDQRLDQAKLESGQVYTISVPALCSAFIEVTNDAYDGCVIQLDGKALSAPYPAQIPRLPAGNHKIVFRWNSGRYVGKELVSAFTGEANHHYRIRGEPSGEKVLVQQIR